MVLYLTGGAICVKKETFFEQNTSVLHQKAWLLQVKANQMTVLLIGHTILQLDRVFVVGEKSEKKNRASVDEYIHSTQASLPAVIVLCAFGHALVERVHVLLHRHYIDVILG